MRVGMLVMALLIYFARLGIAQNGDAPTVPTSAWERGYLLLCGGGKLPEELLHRFYTLGGGEQGKLVVIPTASPRSDHGDYAPWLPLWQGFPWSDVQVVHVRDRFEADNDSKIELLRQATAVWLGGGEQSRLSERLVGTRLEEELKRLLDRGGVLGGTSAGAAICSQVMIREGRREPLFGNGLSILSDVIVDQHFSARRRQERLSRAMLAYPKLAGLGIDEGTGILFCDGSIEVIGTGDVHWYRAGDPEPELEYRADTQWTSGTRVPWSQVVPRR